MRTAKVLFLTALGAGLSPVAPGTVGSLAGLLLYLLVLRHLPLSLELLLFVLVFAFGVKLSGESEGLFGEEDSPLIVVDEVVGMWLALAGLELNFWVVLNGFILFRLFDIYKPLIVDKLDRFPGGWGVMLDDVAAGIMANLLLRVVF